MNFGTENIINGVAHKHFKLYMDRLNSLYLVKYPESIFV